MSQRMRTPTTLLSVLPVAVLAAACLVPAPLPAQFVTGSVQAQTPQAQAPQYDTNTEHLNAVVVGSIDGKPVARVLVTSLDRRLAVMTDSEGRFSFDYHRIVLPTADPRTQLGGSPLRSYGMMGGFPGGINSLPLQFQVRKPGYITNNVTLQIPTTKPDTTEPTLQLKIVPAGFILGHVDPDNGEPPPPGISVQLRRRTVQNGAAMWMSTSGAQVSATGEFRFADLAPGDYKLMTTAWTGPSARLPRPDSVPGLTPIYYPDATDPEAGGLLHVGPAETVTARLTPRSATFYRVTIPIAGAEASQGANVTLQPESSGLFLGFNSQSHEVEGYLPSGSYNARVTLYARPAGGASAPNPGGPMRMIGMSGQPQTSSAVAHIEVGRAPVHLAPVTPLPAFEIPVSVRRDFTTQQNSSNGPNGQRFGHGGAPVFLNLTPVDSNGAGATLAPFGPDASEDNLKLQNVTEGVYRVQVQSTTGGYVASATSGTTDLLRDPLTVTGAGSPFPIEIILRDDAASLTGSVQLTSTASSSSPADSAPIYILGIPLDRPEANPLFSFAMAQNQFQLGMIPPGHYLFVASHHQLFQDVEYRNPDVLRDLMTKGTSINLSARQKAEIQLPLMPEEN
jgi:hypothetical protein